LAEIVNLKLYFWVINKSLFYNFIFLSYFKSNFANISSPKPQLKNSRFATASPIIAATGSQTYCLGTSMKIVTDVNHCPDNIINEIYIQISSGYVNGQDLLRLSDPLLPQYRTQPQENLDFIGGGPSSTAAAFEAAIKDIEFSSSSSPNGIRNFSILLVKPIIYSKQPLL
jgi:hypothetical protein